MSIGTALRTEIVEDSAVTAIVGTQVTVGMAAQKWSLPYVTIQLLPVGEAHTHHMGGGGGLAQPSYQITCWESTRVLAETLATAVREAIDAFRGTMGSGGNTANVRGCFLGPSGDVYVPKSGNNIGVYGVAMTFDLAHAETVPS